MVVSRLLVAQHHARDRHRHPPGDGRARGRHVGNDPRRRHLRRPGQAGTHRSTLGRRRVAPRHGRVVQRSVGDLERARRGLHVDLERHAALGEASDQPELLPDKGPPLHHHLLPGRLRRRVGRPVRTSRPTGLGHRLPFRHIGRPVREPHRGHPDPRCRIRRAHSGGVEVRPGDYQRRVGPGADRRRAVRRPSDSGQRLSASRR